MDLTDGTTLVFDGSRAWVKPAEKRFPPGARFHLLTWPYFLAVPFKLDDPGAILLETAETRLHGEPYVTGRLEFTDGTGDAPDDWYILYADPSTYSLKGMAYIVTYGTSQQEAEKEPHAITYADYAIVNGVVLSTKWTFWLWNKGEGIHGDPIGEVTLSNLHFVEPEDDAFEKPEGAREDDLPEP
jgi:hypothetical protein